MTSVIELAACPPPLRALPDLALFLQLPEPWRGAGPGLGEDGERARRPHALEPQPRGVVVVPRPRPEGEDVAVLPFIAFFPCCH